MSSGSEGLIFALLDGFSDSDSSVRESVLNSLCSLGGHCPLLVLNSAQAYLARQTKLPSTQRAQIMHVINNVCCENINNMEDQLVSLMINLATQEMTIAKDKESDAEWQKACSQVLVTLSRRYCTTVLDCVLQKYQPGSAPHPYVIKTLGSIANANATGFIPFLLDILSRTQPMITSGAAKSDSMKIHFAKAYQSYAEALCEYMADGGTSTDPNITFETFSQQFNTVYDAIMPLWLNSKDYKVRAAVVTCVGNLSYVISKDKLNEELRKLVPAILTLYKKSGMDLFDVSLGLCRLLEASAQHESSPIEHYLEDVWVALYPQVIDDMDYVNPELAKVRNEVLRCFHVTACVNADRLVYYLVQKIQAGQADRSKLSSICILRHLVNSSGPFLSDKRPLVMRGLKPVLIDTTTSIRVRRAICSLAIALADHDYLDGEHGGNVMEFLIKNLIASDDNVKKPTDADVMVSHQLRTQCAQAVLTISKNNTNAQQLMWPYLFELICAPEYTSSMDDICKAMLAIANSSIDEGRSVTLVKQPENPRLPGEHQVFTRLITLIGGQNIAESRKSTRIKLELLSVLSEWIQAAFVPSLPTACEALISKLDSYEDASKSRVQSDWEASVLKVLLDTVTTVNDGTWRQDLAASFGKQMSLYNAEKHSHEKRFLCRCLGGVLTKILDNQFVIGHIELLFKSVNHQNLLERQGCARAVGFCATAHSNSGLVMNQLENIAKWEHQKRSGGFFGFIKDSMKSYEPDSDTCCLRASILLSYGYLVWYCPIDIVTQRLQSTILIFLKPYFENAKDRRPVRKGNFGFCCFVGPGGGGYSHWQEIAEQQDIPVLNSDNIYKEIVVKCALIETINLIADAVHPSHLKADFVLSERAQFFQYILDYLQSENAKSCNSDMRAIAARAIASLVKLDPVLSPSEVNTVMKVVCPYFYTVDTFNVQPSITSEVALTNDNLLDSIHLIYTEMIRKKPVVATLTVAKNTMQSYLSSERDIERIRAFQSTCLLFDVYYNMATDCVFGTATEFSLLGSGFGRFCPRLIDSNREVRSLAFDCVTWLLKLTALHKGLGKDHPDGIVQHLQSLRPRICDAEEVELGSFLDDITKIIETTLPSKQLQTYLSVLFDVVLDKQQAVGSAAASLLANALDLRGQHLVNEAETLVSTILTKMCSLNDKRAYGDLRHSLNQYAIHNLTAVMQCLLNQPLPFSQPVVDCWHTLAASHDLLHQVLDLLCKGMDGSEAVYEQPDGTNVKLVNASALTYTAAVIHVLTGATSDEPLISLLPRLLCVLFIHCGSLVSTQYPHQANIVTSEFRKTYSYPVSIVHVAIKTLLTRLRLDAIVSHLNQLHAWKDFEDTQHYSSAMHQASKALAASYPKYVESLTELLEPKLSFYRDEQRVVAMAVLSAFVKSHPDDKGEPDNVLLAQLVDIHVRCLADCCITVRQLAVRGLGDLAHAERDQLKRYTSVALTAVMSGLEDAADTKDLVALEAMQALNKLATRIERSQIDDVLMSVLLRIRPCFEKENAAVRAIAFELLAQLASFGNCDAYKEQLHTNMCALILHLFDTHSEVQTGCLNVFLQIKDLLGDSAAAVINEQLGKYEDISGESKPCSTNDSLKTALVLCNGETSNSSSSSDSSTKCIIDAITYRSFVREFCKVLTSEFADRLNFYALCSSNYYKSSSSRIRANAALLTGYLLASASAEIRRTVSKELIFSGLSLLLKEPESEVRLCAVDAIANLHKYL